MHHDAMSTFTETSTISFYLDSQLFNKDVGEIQCSDSKCIIVEIFFVIDTRQKLKNGKTTDQSLQKGNRDTSCIIQPRYFVIKITMSPK